MQQKKIKEAVTAQATDGQTPNGEPPQYRENPKTNEKIDAWIKDNPERWAYFTNLPPDRAARKLVLNEVRNYERVQKMNNGIMTKLKANPEALKAYETLVKTLPEDQRERAMVSIARQAFRVTAPRKEQTQQQPREAMGMSV